MYKPINGWTKAKILEHIKANATCKSIKPDDPRTCAYRGQYNAKCAVGIFIPDEKYTPEMDDVDSVRYARIGLRNTTGVRILLKAFPELLSDLPLVDSALLEMQHIHDTTSAHDAPGIASQLCQWVESYVQD